MTRFKPGDRAIVTGDTARWGHPFDAGHVVEIDGVRTLDGGGYTCVSLSLPWGAWGIAEADLRPVESPTPSPLAALIEAGTTFLRAVLDNRVSIEQEWPDPHHCNYRIVVAPEEKS